jgi:TolB-like protein/Flp pilus assembly protein TadD
MSDSFFAELKRRNVFRVSIAYGIMAWLLLQVVDIVASIINAPEWVSQSILLVLGIGFPIAIFFAWAFELTPDGIKREKDVDRTQSITNKTGRRLDYMIIGVLVIAVAWLGFDKLALDSPQEPEETVADVIDEPPSIAVLPFTNMSADADSAYFSDGLADTLLHMLAQIKELRVAARTSSFQFRDQTMDVADIGEQLNVATLLEGSVQRSGDKIRITAQLIDVSNGYHLWSGNFDRELNDVFAIQDEIATEVVAALKLSLLGETAEALQEYSTENIEAYTQYLLAVNDYETNTYDSLTSALIRLQGVTELDPNYTAAYAMLARTYNNLYNTGAMGREEGIANARAAALRALELSPNSSMALSVLGVVELDDGNKEVAEQLLLKAIESGPNDTAALRNYAFYLSTESRPEESIEFLRQVIQRDPLATRARSMLANNLIRLRRFDEAIIVAARIQEINPQGPYGLAESAFANQMQGNWAAATQLWKQAAAKDPNDPELAVFVGDQYLSLDLPLESGQWYGRAAEIDPGHPVSLSRPLVLNWVARENDNENVRQARKLLDDNIENRWGSRSIAAYMLFHDAEQTHDYSTFLETLDNLHPHLFDEPPSDIANELEMTFLVGRALVQSGQTERGFQLLGLWSDEVTKFEAVFGITTNSIEIDLLRGDKQAALVKLQARDSMKYDDAFDRLFFARDSLWQTLADEPQFIELVEDLDQHAAEQRVILQAMDL